MSYVRALWVVVPITLVMVALALFFAWMAVFTGRSASFEATLPKSFVVVAVFGFIAAGFGGGGASLARSAGNPSPASRDRQPGEVSLSPGAACFISSAIVAVIAVLIY